ncbi:50S ribosomal protein L4 [Candidatus Woesearchaeota archaeon]|nr:50S ribosomal protein L4 [Candidatus Woesearchaeota archaeon]
MQLKILNESKVETGKIELPLQFKESIRPDMIKRAVLVINSNNRQPYGAYIKAGMRASAELSRRRHKYRGSYGAGISRVPRKIMSRRGTRLNWVGAFAPGTVKGRRAHPPKAEKVWARKINKKERRMAIRSAMAAGMVKELVKARGHKVPEHYPFVMDTKVEDIARTKDFMAMLCKLGFQDELARVAERKIRAGRGTMRGRKYKTRKGPLVIVSKDCPLLKAGRNMPGVEVIMVDKLNARSLAPNSTIGRLCLYSKSSIERIADEGLFTDTKNMKKTKASCRKQDNDAAGKNTAEKPSAKKPSAEKRADAGAGQ